MSNNRIEDLLKQADTTDTLDAKGLEALEGRPKELLTQYLEEVEKRSGAEMGPGVIPIMLLLRSAEAAASLWALLHAANWVTLHDAETGDVVRLGECDPATCLFRVTPLFKTDPNLIPAAIAERELNS